MLRAGQQALVGQLFGQPYDVLLVEPASEALGHRQGQLVVVAPTVGLLQQRIHQRSEMNHLPVVATDEGGALLVPGPVYGSEQLDPLAPVQGS